MDVYFDDLKVTHELSDIVAGADYYPFGLKMDGREITRESFRFGYQGQFAEEDEETGWNSFELRMYDPVIGRWATTDPAGQYWSPYIGMGNNPINGIDPDGGFKTKRGAWLYSIFNGGGDIFHDGHEYVVFSQKWGKGNDGQPTLFGETETKWNKAININLQHDFSIGVQAGAHVTGLQGVDVSLVSFTLYRLMATVNIDLDNGIFYNYDLIGAQEDSFVKQFLKIDIPYLGGSISREFSMSNPHVTKDHLEVHGGLPAVGLKVDADLNRETHQWSISGSAGGRAVLGADVDYNITLINK